jgi:hypothetical protein
VQSFFIPNSISLCSVSCGSLYPLHNNDDDNVYVCTLLLPLPRRGQTSFRNEVNRARIVRVIQPRLRRTHAISVFFAASKPQRFIQIKNTRDIAFYTLLHLRPSSPNVDGTAPLLDGYTDIFYCRCFKGVVTARTAYILCLFLLSI